MSNPMNNQSFDINTDAGFDKALTFFRNDMNLVSSSVEADVKKFFTQLAENGTATYQTRGFGTFRQVVWKYNNETAVAMRVEVVMPKNAKGIFVAE